MNILKIKLRSFLWRFPSSISLLLFVALLLAACQTSGSLPASGSTASAPTAAAQPLPSAAPAEARPTAAAVPMADTPTQTPNSPTPRPPVGKIEWLMVDSPALANNPLGDPPSRLTGVYLPPGYSDHLEQRYPVVYVLHGYGQGPEDLFFSARVLEHLLVDGKAGEMILVFVDCLNLLDGCWYRNSPATGDYETYIVEDLIGQVDTAYRTLPGPDHRGLTGFSMGGYGALYLGLKYPSVFGAVVAESAPYDLQDRFLNASSAVASQISDALTASNPTPTRLARLRGDARLLLSILAAMASSPAHPPLFLADPYETTSGKLRLTPHAAGQLEQASIFSLAEQYAQGEEQLSGILIVHGSLDRPEPARLLSDHLTGLGIANEFSEHNGGHIFLPEPALRFLWERIQP